MDGREYSVWFDETGMQIAVGHTVADQILDKAFLSWKDVSRRIHQLLNQGEYAPQSVLDVARDNALKEHAQALAYMKGDMAEGVAEIVFDEADLPHLRSIYPRSSCLSGNTDRQKRQKQRKKSEDTYNERRGIKPMENVRSEDRTYLQEFPQIMPDQLHITVPALKITET